MNEEGEVDRVVFAPFDAALELARARKRILETS